MYSEGEMNVFRWRWRVCCWQTIAERTAEGSWTSMEGNWIQNVEEDERLKVSKEIGKHMDKLGQFDYVKQYSK